MNVKRKCLKCGKEVNVDTSSYCCPNCGEVFTDICDSSITETFQYADRVEIIEKIKKRNEMLRKEANRKKLKPWRIITLILLPFILIAGPELLSKDHTFTIGCYVLGGYCYWLLVGLMISVSNAGYFRVPNCYLNTDAVKVGDSSPYIRDRAFSGRTDLTKVIILDGVTSIGKKAFADCRNLISITIPNSVTKIEKGAFDGCFVEEAIIPKNACLHIRNLALKKLVLTNGTEIKEDDLRGCRNLASITIPNSVTKIEEYAFAVKHRHYDSELDYYYTSDYFPIVEATVPSFALKYLNKEVEKVITTTSPRRKYSYEKGGYRLKSVIIYDGKIESNEFSNQKELKSVVISDVVTSIGDSAFYGCISLTSITIPDSVTSIGTCAFVDCPIGKATIPAWSFKSINNARLHDITVTGWCINKAAFKNASNLKSVTISDSVTKIDGEAFKGCSSLTSITLPNGVKSIGDEAFENCTNLTNITIPDSVTWIGCNAFFGCNKLNYNIYDNARYLGNGYNPYLVLARACDATITTCTINDSTKIACEAFYDCMSLTRVIIGEKLTSISRWMFSGCRYLNSVIIPESVREIGDKAFFGCSNLTNIIFKGTKVQWKAIIKGEYWKYGTDDFIVHCSDDNISKSCS